MGEIFDKMCVDLARLSLPELREIAARVQMLLGSSTSGDESLLREIHSCWVELRSGVDCPALVVFLRSKHGAYLVDVAAKFDVFLSDTFGRLKNVERRHIVMTLVGCAIQDLQNSRAPTNFVPVCTMLGNIWNLLERHFPGYAEAGLLRHALVVGSFENGGSNETTEAVEETSGA